jgi:hypothetical protein
MKTSFAGLALGLALASTAAYAGQLDKLGGLMGGSGSSLTAGSAGNAAGIIQYCISNNYLGGSSGASGVKDKLLGSLSGNTTAPEPTQDKGYLAGAKGLLTGSNGKTTTDLNQLGGIGGSGGGTDDMKAKLVHKACDAVLKQGKKMAGM